MTRFTMLNNTPIKGRKHGAIEMDYIGSKNCPIICCSDFPSKSESLTLQNNDKKNCCDLACWLAVDYPAPCAKSNKVKIRWTALKKTINIIKSNRFAPIETPVYFENASE